MHWPALVETLRKESNDKSAAADQRIKVLEDESRALRAYKSESTAEIGRLKLEIAREEEATSAASEKCALVQKQLDTVSDKLLSLENKQSLDAVKNRENEEKAGLVEGLKTQLAKALEEVETEKAHASNFRKVAVSTEAMLKDLQDSDKKGTEKC